MSTETVARDRDRASTRTTARWRLFFAGLLVTVLATAVYGSFVRYRLRNDYHGNYSGFLQLSRDTFDGNPLVRDLPQIRQSVILLDNNGYDGQFMYYMTFDPFMRRFDSYRTVVDYPPYRFGRIGFSLLTKIASRDRWRRYPATMVALIMGGIALSAAAVCAMAVDAGLSPVWGLVIVAIPGFWESLQVALPEPLAAGLILSACWCVSRRWIVAGALFLALSLLIRETGLVCVVCLAGWELVKGRRNHAWRLGLIAVTPLVCWRLYVGWSQFPMYGTEAFFVNPHDFGAPFGGVLDMWRALAQGAYAGGAPAEVRAAMWYPMVMTGGVALAIVLSIRSPSATSLAACLYGFVAVSLNFEGIWGGVGQGVRDTFELFVLLAAASLGWRRYSPALRFGIVTFWAASAAFVFLGSVQATPLRAALLSALRLG